MARFASQKNPISARGLKRKDAGSVVVCHGAREDVKFTRMTGGWLRSRTDVCCESTYVVSSTEVARECNGTIGCKSSWARVY